MDLEKESLVQEYIANPFLIDGRRFSIGIFVAFSSTNPTRAYVWDSDLLLRFCAKAYYPLDFTDTRTYITDGLSTFGILMWDQV